MTPVVEVKNLNYVYSAGTPFKMDAIKDLSFAINRGETVGIIGHTGSGKSTLVQHLNGLLRPASGTVLVNGADIWEKPKEIRKIRFIIGLVFQYPEYQLFDETVAADIGFGPRNMGLSEEEIAERVKEMAGLVGLNDDLLQKSPFEISGGEKRRAAIAGVLAMHPECVVLDEPTAGLDPNGRALILERIRQYKEQHNATIIMVSHSMEDIAAMCDRVMVLSSGKIVKFGTVAEVYSDSEMLRSIGLNVPAVTQIATRLRERDLPVDADVFTMQDTVKAILAARKGAGRNA